MIEIEIDAGASAEFRIAAQTFRHAALRSELGVVQISAPQNLASEAIAFAANIETEATGAHGDLGTGRFILLHEATEQEQWGGCFRIVCFAKSPLETDLGSDAQMAEVSWDWLTESLIRHGARFAYEAGTATRIISSGFGSLAGQSDHAELEMRASWSPLEDEMAAHLEAWQDLVCIMSGFPPVVEGVTALKVNR
ncbi:MAG: hypothetical protein RL196_1008 [Actinomycetota bacterium]